MIFSGDKKSYVSISSVGEQRVKTTVRVLNNSVSKLQTVAKVGPIYLLLLCRGV